MTAQHIGPLVQVGPSYKVKLLIAAMQSQFGYTISYKKAWMAREKVIARVYGTWDGFYEELPKWLVAVSTFVRDSIIELDVVSAYHSEVQLPDHRFFRRLFWSYAPCIRAFKHCKPVIQVDRTYLYGQYKGTLLIVVAQDGNQNILLIVFAIIEGETMHGIFFFFFGSHFHRYVVTQDGVGNISNRHESIKAAINKSGGQWQPPRAFHKYYIRHITTNFLCRFKKPNLHRLVISIGKLIINYICKCDFIFVVLIHADYVS